MSKRNVLLAGCLVLVAAISTLTLQADPPKQKSKQEDQKQFPLLRQQHESQNVIAGANVAPLMQRKLDHAKEILEGLVMEDHKKIAKSARAMKLLSLEAGWNVVQTQEYMQQSRDFRRACDLIENAAKEKDANRAALSYVALTVRCVECHSYLRDNKIVLTSKQD